MRLPYLAEVVGTGMLLAVRAVARLHVTGLDHYRQEPSTLIVINHKRDLDVLVAPPTLYFSRGWLRAGRRISFVAREDMFLPGFLGFYPDFPLWIRRLLCRLDLSSALGRLWAAPMRRFPERSLRELLLELREIVGSAPLGACFTPEALARWPAGAADLRVADLAARCDVGWLREPARLGLLLPDVRVRARGRQREVVAHQLAHFVTLLDAGGIVYLAPEGVLSPDGRLGRLRDAFEHLLTTPKVPVRVLPAGISYDFLRTDRLDAHLALGPLLEGLRALPREERLRLVRRTLAALVTVTTSQIAGWLLWHAAQAGMLEVAARPLADRVVEIARTLVGRGRRVDVRILHEPWFVRRWRRFLAYGPRRGLWAVRDGHLVLDPDTVFRSGTGYKENPLRYAASELASLLDELGERVQPLAGTISPGVVRTV